MKAYLALAVFTAVLCQPLEAVILATGDGTQNTTGTGAGAGWDYVGQVSGASGVYLGTYGGQQWVITGWHVAENNYTLGTTTYNAVAGSSIRVKNADNTDTDLRLFRIEGDPGLSNLSITSSAVPEDSSLTLIGYGRNRNTALTRWNVTVVAGDNNDIWTEVGSGGNAQGYGWDTGNTKRWGINEKGSTSVLGPPYPFGSTDVFLTDFDNTTNQAQGSVGDSGGGVFYFDGGQWQLAGIMLAIGGFDNQPANTSVFGNVTYIADLSQYETWIMAAIPEPSTYALLVMSGVMLGVGLRISRWRGRGRTL
jgi:hypothetical protein